MLKPEFVKKVKEALNLSSEKAADEVIDKFTALVTDIIKSGEDVTVGSLGKFVVVERAARKCRNPRTGEEMDVPAKKVLKYKPTGALRKSLND